MFAISQRLDPMLYRYFIVLSFVLSLPTAPVSANQENLLEEVVVTANRTGEPWLRADQSITVIDQTSIETVGATHVNELAAQSAGTWISRGNGQEHLTAIRSPVLTGAGGCGAFLMLQDNIPLRASGFCNVNELFESASELASTVEILKGPGTAAHGSNALHGIVHIRTPEPGDRTRQTSLEGGPHDYARVKHVATFPNAALAFSGTHDGGYKDDAGFDQQKLLIKLRSQSAAWRALHQLAATNLNQETSGFIQGDDAYRIESLKQSNPNPEAFRDAQSLKLVSDWQHADLPIAITPFFRWTDMRFLMHFLPGQPLEENGHTSLGLQSRYALSDQLDMGIDLEVTDAFLKQTQFSETIGSPFLVGTLPLGKHYDYEVSATVAAIYGQYRLPITDRLSADLGLRAEHVTYDYDNLMQSGRTRDDGSECGFGGCRYNRPDSREDSFTNLSPKLALHFELGSHHLFANLSQGFRAPQATELYRLQGGQSVVDIDSESLNAIELGVRGASPKLRYQVAAFAMKKDQFIFKDTDRANVDNGQTRHHGLEVEAQLALNESFDIALNWALARHRYDNNPALARSAIEGNDIDTAPRSFGGIRLNWRPTPSINTQLEWVHLGEYFTNPENSNAYDGHDLLNLRGQLALSDEWQMFFRVTNLSDTDYAERADFAFGRERFFVGEPRSVYIGIRRSR